MQFTDKRLNVIHYLSKSIIECAIKVFVLQFILCSRKLLYLDHRSKNNLRGIRLIDIYFLWMITYILINH